jgi:hypothetical protein
MAGSWYEDSPDPRFAIWGLSDEIGVVYYVSFSEFITSEQGDEVDNPLFETEMPDGEEMEAFSYLEDADEFVREMAKCLDDHGPPAHKFIANEVELALAHLSRAQSTGVFGDELSKMIAGLTAFKATVEAATESAALEDRSTPLFGRRS